MYITRPFFDMLMDSLNVVEVSDWLRKMLEPRLDVTRRERVGQLWREHQEISRQERLLLLCKLHTWNYMLKKVGISDLHRGHAKRCVREFLYTKSATFWRCKDRFCVICSAIRSLETQKIASQKQCFSGRVIMERRVIGEDYTDISRMPWKHPYDLCVRSIIPVSTGEYQASHLLLRKLEVNEFSERETHRLIDEAIRMKAVYLTRSTSFDIEFVESATKGFHSVTTNKKRRKCQTIGCGNIRDAAVNFRYQDIFVEKSCKPFICL